VNGDKNLVSLRPVTPEFTRLHCRMCTAGVGSLLGLVSPRRGCTGAGNVPPCRLLWGRHC